MDALCVAAIDIGISHSCLMFSFRNNPGHIESRHCWKGSGYAQQKVPSVVLFNKNREFHSFGFEAENHFSSLGNEEERSRWYLFEGFSKVTSDSSVENSLSDVTGKQMETYKVYGSAIKFFKDTVSKLFTNRGLALEDQDLHFVMIVPAILRKSYKKMLQQSFLYAGFKDGSYSFVRESDAVLSYWKYKWSKKTEHPDLNNGECFLIVNLRGRTATITAQKASSGILDRLHNVTGGGWGGQAVNEEFKQLLIKIVGAPVFLEFVNKEKHLDWLDLETDFEKKKRSLCAGTVRVRMPVRLNDMYHESLNESLQDAVEASPYAEKIRFTAGKMIIDASVMKGLFKNTIETIISNIKNTLANDAVKETQTEVIILIGGFSNSPLVQDAVKQAFPDCTVLVPEEPAFTTVEGAILHGHHAAPAQPGVVSRFTYGVQICQINDEGGRSEVERSETKIFIRKGDVVHEKDEVTWKLHLEACDEEHAEVLFFASPRNETLSVDGDDVEFIKMIRLHFDGSFAKEVVISIYQRNSHIMGYVFGEPVDFGKFK